MTTTRGPLTDALLRDALRELAAGPDASALTADVLRSLDDVRQLRAGVPWPAFLGSRRAQLVGLAALLAVGLIGALLAAGGFHATIMQPLVPGGPPAMVIQRSNGLRDPAFRVMHTQFVFGSSAGTSLVGLPPNAVGLRWSPDGARLAYFEEAAPQGLHSTPLTALRIGSRDGGNAVSVVLPRSIDQYASNGFSAGVKWAPTSDRFLLSWSTYTCPSDPDCVPEGGVDVFDMAGQVIATIPTPDNVEIDAFWSPDGRAVGWTSGSCVDGACSMDQLHWRRLEGDLTVTTVSVPGATETVWSRIGVLVVTSNGGVVDRVYAMQPDGTNVAEVPWPHTDELLPHWSPDGHWLASIDWDAGTLRLYDMRLGTDVLITVPTNMNFAAWAPDSGRLIVFGDDNLDPTATALYSVSTDGQGFISLGDGEDFGWLPR
jgi:hypothetical protein